jgi:lipopolysaccharide biosynthesis protein
MVAVLLHVFHTDLWPEILSLLLDVKDLIAIDISLSENHDNKKILQDLKPFRIIKIRYTDNHGVDISPFLHQIKELDPNLFPYFIKLHTKKSFINKFHWRLVLFNALLGSKDILQSNIKKLETNTGIGAITDKTTIMSSIGHNTQHIKLLCDFLHIDRALNKKFMAGSMFMSRTHIFKKYLNSNTIYYIDMLLEDGVVKDEHQGTFCHAMERIFGKIVHQEKLKISYTNLDPYIKIHNTTIKKTFILYKCDKNNYCYNFDPIHRVFGCIYHIAPDSSNVLIDWEHLPNYDHHFRLYHRLKDGKYASLL